MYRKKPIILFISFLLIILCSCEKENTPTAYRTVTHVDIITKYNGQILGRHYNTPEKIRPVLLYLRLLKPIGKEIVPDNKNEDIYLITISLSDGDRHYYRQASHRYLSKENGPYKSIDPKMAAELYRILQTFTSDM